jgi:hypothetical protein
MFLFYLAVCGAYSIDSYAAGLVFGPYNNEKVLLENNGEFSLTAYKFPLFMGGLYNKIHFGDYEFFYYSDLAFNIHKTELAGGGGMDNYLLYFHNDLNVYLLDQILYLGFGLELAAINRYFSNGYNGSNNYITTHYYGYLNGGVSWSLGVVELGFKVLYRMAPFSSNFLGNGEIGVTLGLNPFRNRKTDDPAKRPSY